MGSIGEIGSFLVDPLGIGYGDAIHGVKDKDDKRSAPQQEQRAAAVAPPTGPQADVNKQLLEKQGADRRRRLLYESTGRTSPTGPSITTEPTNQRTLL